MHNEEKYYTKNNRFISVVLNLNILFVCFVLQIERVTRSIYNIYNEGGNFTSYYAQTALAFQRDFTFKFSWNNSSFFDSTFTRDRLCECLIVVCNNERNFFIL